MSDTTPESENLFRIVEASQEDATALAAVQAQAFAKEVAKYGSGPPGYDSAAWQITIMNHSHYFKILAGDRIVGGIVVRDEGNEDYYLHRLFVLPEFQRHRIGSQALAFIEATFPARRWSLHTPSLSDGNRRFYERHGYKKINERRLDDPKLPDDFMLCEYEKILPEQKSKLDIP